MKYVRLLLGFFIFGQLAASKCELAVTAIFQNEAPYLREWLEYHKLIGVERFYLFNHYSSDNFREILEPYIRDETVKLVDLECGHNVRVRNIQPGVYKSIIKELQGEVKWLAIIDIDEFLLPMTEKDLPTTLRKHFDKASLIYVNWRNFGTSQKRLSHNDTRMIPNLTSCSLKSHPRNAIGKSIVRVDHVDLNKKPTPHFPILLRDKIVKYGDGKLFGGDGKPFNQISDLRSDGQHHDKYLRINHYFTRDEGFWRDVKIPRILNRGEKMDIYDIMYNAFIQCKDTKIIDFLRKYHPHFLKTLNRENK